MPPASRRGFWANMRTENAPARTASAAQPASCRVSASRPISKETAACISWPSSSQASVAPQKMKFAAFAASHGILPGQDGAEIDRRREAAGEDGFHRLRTPDHDAFYRSVPHVIPHLTHCKSLAGLAIAGVPLGQLWGLLYSFVSEPGRNRQAAITLPLCPLMLHDTMILPDREPEHAQAGRPLTGKPWPTPLRARAARGWNGEPP